MPSSPEQRRTRYAAKRLTKPTPPPGKKRCANCGDDFKPNPSRKDHRFCKDSCRKQFHKFGTSLPKLLDKLRDIVEVLFQERQAELERITTEARATLKEVRRLHREAIELKSPRRDSRVKQI